MNKLTAILVACILMQINSYAQTFKHYTSANTSTTLASNYCYSVKTDGLNNVWVATFGGLSKFDGQNWTSYSKENGLVDFIITSVVTDNENTPWVGSYNGLCHFNGVSWTVYSTENGLSSNNVECVTTDNINNIWVGSYRAIDRFDGQSWTSYNSHNGFDFTNVTEIVVDANGIAWANCSQGIITLTDNGWEQVIIDSTARWITINTIDFDKANNLWVGTNLGVYKQSGNQFVKYTTANGLLENGIKKIHFDLQGMAWLVGQNSLAKYDGATFTSVSNDINLNASAINDITSDAEGNVYLATTEGLAQYTNTDWIVYKSTGLLSNADYRIACTDDNSKWITSNLGLSKMTSDTIINYTSFPNMTNSSTLAATCTKNGDLWISVAYSGAGGGLSCFNGTSWKSYRHNNTALPADYSIWGICEDNNGNIWVIGDRHYAYEFNGSQWIRHDFNSLPLTITCDANNNIWVAAERNLYKYNGDSWSTVEDDLFRELTAFTRVAIDSLKHLWVGANDGLYHYDEVSWKKFTTADGLPLNFISDLTVDYAGNLWMHAGGLVKYDYDTFVEYDTQDSVFSSGSNDISPSKDGSIWLGTHQGLFSLAFDPVQLNLSQNTLHFDGTPIAGQAINITSDTDWKITTHCDWITCSLDNGTNDEQFTIMCLDNTSGQQRTSDVYIRSNSHKLNKVTVVQDGMTSALQPEKAKTIGYVYHNKQTQQLQVNYPMLKQVEIFDLSGKTILTSNRKTINISTLNSGIYCVRVITESGILRTHKISR